MSRKKWAIRLFTEGAESGSAPEDTTPQAGVQPNDPPNDPLNDPSNEPSNEPSNDPSNDQSDEGETPERKNATDEAGNDLGYPENTPLDSMSDPERVAYWRHTAKKRQKDLRNLQTEHDRMKTALERSSMDDFERDLAEKEDAAREEGRTTLLESLKPKLVAREFRAQAGALDVALSRIDTLMETLKIDAFFDDETLDVDSEAVKTYLTTVLIPDLKSNPTFSAHRSPNASGSVEFYMSEMAKKTPEQDLTPAPQAGTIASRRW